MGSQTVRPNWATKHSTAQRQSISCFKIKKTKVKEQRNISLQIVGKNSAIKLQLFCVLKRLIGTALVAQGLRLCLPAQGVQDRSLVAKIPHASWAKNQNRKQKQRCNKLNESASESWPVMPDSLQPHGLYTLWNSPGQNTGVGSLSLLQGIFPTQGSNTGLPHCRQILYQLSRKGSPLKTLKMFHIKKKKK